MKQAEIDEVANIVTDLVVEIVNGTDNQTKRLASIDEAKQAIDRQLARAELRGRIDELDSLIDMRDGSFFRRMVFPDSARVIFFERVAELQAELSNLEEEHDHDDTLQAKSVPIRYIPLLERLTEQDRIDLADWVRSKKPGPRIKFDGDWEKNYNMGYNASLDDFQQALLADLEKHDE